MEKNFLMNPAMEFDVGPLTWVKNEIDLALARADEALDHFSTNVASPDGDTTQIKFCRTHLHQVQGALTIVGLDGVTQFVEALEAMLEGLEQHQIPFSDSTIALAKKALATIGHYLSGLVNGQPNQPLQLLPLYREIQAERGMSRVSAADLFFPDLSVRPPRRDVPARKMPLEEFQKFLKQERGRFQRGLLAWLRAPQDRKGVREMFEAVRRIEETQESASARAFWWVASGLFAALAEGSMPAEANVKQLCARIDLQIRRLLEGSKNVAERLMRDALYFVANAKSGEITVQDIQQAYHLEAAIATDREVAVSPGDEAALGKLHDIAATLEESWNKFCAGSPKALHVFKENAGVAATTVAQLGNEHYLLLAKTIAAAADWLAEDASRHSDALAMEVATAILLMQNARENFRLLDKDFEHRVNVIVARVNACLAGKPLLPGSEIPLLDEMSRQAQEKLLLGQVAKEIQSNLVQIEQVLDSFFRDSRKRSELGGLDAPFRQIIGALAMMHQEAAVAELQECLEQVQLFAKPEYEPAEADFESVAGKLSMIGFFIEAMPQQGAVDYAGFVRQMQMPAAEEERPEEESEIRSSVEQEVAQNKLETHALLGALKEQPEDAGLREEIRHNLQALKNDADLVADTALGEQTKAMLSALESGAEAPQIEQVMAMLKPEPVAPAPSVNTLQLSQASNEEIDAELLGIFLEEANEVLATINDNLRQLKQETDNIEFLTTIRRSFHTLKGSGRMVGLKDVGEAAWAIEQTLNQWLRLEQEVTPTLLDLLDQAATVFSAWVKHLETREGIAPDPTGMIELADALRSGHEQVQTIILPVVVDSEEADGEAAEMPGELAPALEFAAHDEAEQPGAEIIQVDFTPITVVDGDDEAEAEWETEQEEHLAEVLPISAGETGAAADGIDETAPPPVMAEVARPGISPALFEVFSAEAKGHLAALRSEFSALDSEEAVPTPQSMSRAAHTLAGISATVGLTPINQLSYALEHALQRRDHAEHPQSLQALGIVDQAIGELELMFSALASQQRIDVPSALIDELNGLYPARALADSGPDEIPAPAETIEEKMPEAPAPRVSALSGILVPTDEIDEQLLPIFLEEAIDLNQSIAAQLRAWRTDPGNKETVHVLARLLHTLKGSARMAGVMSLGEMTHALETRVEQVDKTGNATSEIIDEIDNAFESVRQIVDRMQQGESSGSLGVPIPAVALAEDTTSGEAVRQEIPATVPSAEQRLDKPSFGEAEVESDIAQQAILRVRANVIDRLVNGAGELSIARSRIEGEMRSLKESLLDLTENVIRLRRQLREIEIQAESQIQSRVSAADEKHPGFDPLEFDRFTRFQELTRMMAESVNDVSTVQQNLLKNLDDANAAIIAQARLNREVQQELMAVRMEPFSSLTDRMYRIVRQTSKELNKRVNLEIKGEQVELDRGVLDKIAAPIEHMLRNAIVHGIESREKRIARGKPEMGDISLSLRQEGNEVILVMADDGAGLDFERIRARAIASGLLRADEDASHEQLADLIFASGFTTAEGVSQIAGRGVGMDVVKTEIGALGGRVEISSTPGQGTEFRLIIPLTLAVTKALMVRVGSRTYAIPSSMVEQVIDLKEASLNRIRDARSAEWMGHQYPFSYLPHLLGEWQTQPEQHRQYWVIMLRSGTRRISVLVDELQGNREIVVKNIGPQLARIVGVDGATVLGDGQVVLILNPVALSTRAQAEMPTVSTVTVKSAEPVSMLPTVMVVDDSLTVRKITGRLLEREGYRVLTAKDGVEALETLHDVLPDVMLVDIEMPRMDGFDLSIHVRADERLKNIPIIMITSRTAEKHRNYAFEIGVNHYLGKPYQEDELLQLVAGYTAQRQQLS